MMKKFGLCLIVAVALVAFNLPQSFAADFPEKDITLICPWSAGGGTDTIARALVKNAKEYFGVNVNVVNKTGGMASIGMGSVATARPDGYTVGMITFHLSVYRLMGLADLSYKDFSLLQLVNQSPSAISVSSDSEWETLEDLMSYAKENPGIVTVGHTGAGGAWHLAIASLAVQNGVEFTYVPFDGAAPTRTALLGKHVSVAATGIDEVLQLHESGQVRILAVNAPERHPRFPEVPTISEAGFPVPNPIMDWRALGAPKGIAEDRLNILVDGFKKCFDDPEFQQLAKELGLPLAYRDPQGTEEFLAGMEESLQPALEAVELLKPVK